MTNPLHFVKTDLAKITSHQMTEELKHDFISYVPESSHRRDYQGIESLFPGLNPASFTSEYLGSNFYHSKNNSWHSDYINKDFFNDLATHSFSSKHVHYSYAGSPLQHEKEITIIGQELLDKTVSDAHFSFRIAPLFKYSHQCSILLRKIEYLEALFGAEVGAIAFFSKDNESVIPPHWDTEDLIVCQLSGRKKWKFFRNKFKNPLRQHKFGFNTELCKIDDEPAGEIILEEGDILYLPKGLGHYAQAIDGDSLHVTYGIYHPSVYDVMGELIKAGTEVLSYTAEARDSFNFHNLNSLDIIPAQKRLQQIFESIDVTRFLKFWPTQYQLFNEERFEAVTSLKPQDSNELVRSDVRILLLKDKNVLNIHTYGRIFDIPEEHHEIFINEINQKKLTSSNLNHRYSQNQVDYFLDFIHKLRIFL